jgi:hypothetical protein
MEDEDIDLTYRWMMAGTAQITEVQYHLEWKLAMIEKGLAMLSIKENLLVEHWDSRRAPGAQAESRLISEARHGVPPPRVKTPSNSKAAASSLFSPLIMRNGGNGRYKHPQPSTVRRSCPAIRLR